MAAQDRARGNAGGFLCRIPTSKFWIENQSGKATAPPRQIVSYLLDTNIVSEWVKPRPSTNVTSWLAEVDEDDIFISVCTLAELRFGVALMSKGKRRDALDIWLRSDLPARFDGRIVPIDVAIADVWGELGARARKKGRSIDVMDGLLAAT